MKIRMKLLMNHDPNIKNEVIEGISILRLWHVDQVKDGLVRKTKKEREEEERDANGEDHLDKMIRRSGFDEVSESGI